MTKPQPSKPAPRALTRPAPKAKAATGTSLVAIKKQMAALAAEEREAEPVVLGNFLSVKGKVFSFQGATLDDPLRVVILDHCFENQYYGGVYDESNPQPPSCFAIGKDEKQMAPPEDDIPGLERQSEACAGCLQNEWASAATGRGKACKNGRKLALIGLHADQELTPEFVDKATVAFLRLSPTALRGFSGYLKRITGTLQVPLFGVVTELSFDDSLTYPSVVTTLADQIGDEAVLAAIMRKREEIQDDLVSGPTDLTPRQQAPKPKKAPPRKAPPAARGKAAPAGRATKY